MTTLNRLSALPGRRGSLLAGLAALAGAMLPGSPVAAPPGRQGTARAGLLITGQSNAGFFLEDGGIWTLNQGLAVLLGIEQAAFDPRLDGFRSLAGYALREGAHRNPAMATTYGGTPLWAPDDEGAFLRHRPDASPAQWPHGAAGRALDRFIRELLTAEDRAACLGILWLHSESDSRSKRMGDVPTHAAAIRRHLALIRAAFGRPATGSGALPAYGWSPIPYGDNSEGHRAVRAALAEVVADEAQNFRLALPQTADSNSRGGTDWSHRDAADLLVFARRAAYAIARDQRPRLGLPPADWPGPGPAIAGAHSEGPSATLVTVRHDRGRRLKASAAARNGRGWSVFDGETPRVVTGLEILGPDRLLLRHEACQGMPAQRAVGYCLLGEQLGRGNAVTDDWSGHAALPPGLGAEWRLDFPLQATLLPLPCA